MTQPQDANDLLMGGGVKSVKWADYAIGHTVIGTITETPKAVQMTKYLSTDLDFWPSGDPKMQIVVTIQTDQRDPSNAQDDGRRRLYIEPRMMSTVREAVQRAGAKGLEIGGRIAVRWVSGSGLGEGNARQFAAEYGAPVVDPGSMLAPSNGNGHAAAATPQQAPMLGGNGAAPAQQPAPTQLQQSVLGAPAPAPASPPQGVDPAVWANLPDGQRAAILASMAPAAVATGQPAF